MAFAERFGATVDIATTASDVGYFLVRRQPSVDHGQFRAAVAFAVGGREYIHLDAPSGFVVVATQYNTAQALGTHPMVDHVGGITVDPDRLPTPTVEVRDARDEP